MGIFQRVSRYLEPDERLITKEMYEKRPWIYEKVIGAVYIITDLDGNKDLIWGSSLKFFVDRFLSGELSIYRELILVRVRDANPVLISGEYISRSEFKKDPYKYEILDICVQVVHRDRPRKTVNISVEEYQIFINDYDLIDVSYLVRNSAKVVLGSLGVK